jgi:hypothetical protein
MARKIFINLATDFILPQRGTKGFFSHREHRERKLDTDLTREIISYLTG